MKLITALLALLALSSISTVQAESEPVADESIIEERQEQFKRISISLLSDFNLAKDLAKNNIEKDRQEFSFQLCKMLINLQDMVTVSNFYNDLQIAHEAKEIAEGMLTTVYDTMERNLITEGSCKDEVYGDNHINE
ncbi:hypothetical protein G0029_17790 (plasmid) [Acinetobacter sp. YH12138]|uniref:hypothetical protein n=1 Tax=Acinetobacter sp. YH12138 TaxID=2601122 RepID=UPI0015D25B2E|nr:hypothetical protein [Acinetobacter sp. YH12138]QOW51618.1 hypothetical protein G0029_17790 [Acinetobacter sp. YH12138]